ncbi:MAG: CRISPR-associated endonuclease Cas2 [Candidatus Paceibacterota bacterium]|jgi:spore maturation protein CgeB
MAKQRKIFYYKGMRVNAFGLPISSDSINSRKIPKEDRIRSFYNVSFSSSFKKDSPKNLIVMYDISHEKKKERDWFRRHLKKFDYIMIQKSVWVGPSPLSKDFLEYIESIGLKDKMKTFKLAKPFTGDSNSI